MQSVRVWLGLLVFLVPMIATAGEPASYHAGAARFASDMGRKHGFDEGQIAALLDQASYSQAVIAAIRRPYEDKPWYRYRPVFLTDKRIQGGVAFWREHVAFLERAEDAYGIPPQIIAAIIGVETNYGHNLGKYRVIDALSTLGFSYPERSDFFRKELEEFLLLARDEGIDALRVTGSYAGAVGLPQFIPSSYRAYAVDFDRDGKRDLWVSAGDAIGSVGNYLMHHGWKAGEPVAFAAEVTGELPEGVAVTEKKPKKPVTSLGRLREMGIATGGSMPGSVRVTLIRLDAPEPEYWVGLWNFYAITRYNHSNLYAMAVYQLSGEIQTAYETRGKTRASGNRFESLGE